MDGIRNQIAYKTGKISKQTPVECTAVLDGDLDKVLAITADAQVDGFDLLDKECKIGGSIIVSVMYKTVDDQLNTVTTNCTFGDVVKSDVITPNSKAFVSAKVISFNPAITDSSNLKIVVTVDTTLDVVDNIDFENFSTQNQDICQRTEDVQACSLVGLNCSEFDVQSTANAGENIKKVLAVDSNAIISDVTAADGLVVIGGQVCTYIVALTGEDKFRAYQICEEFKEEIAFDGVTSESVVNAFARVKKDAVKVVLDEADNQMTLVVSTPIKLCARAFASDIFDITKDVYSTKNELQITTQKYQNTVCLKPRYFESKIEGNLSLGEQEPRIDKVLASSCPTLNVTNSYFDDGQIVVEGVVNTNVIYLNDDENKINSVEMEIPFKITEKTDIEAQDVQVDAYAVLCDCDCMAKRGREIYYDCKIKVFVNLCTSQEFETITQVTDGRVLPQNDSAIEIYFAKSGDTFWDIAKELRISEEHLLTQNPDLVSPLQNDEKIVVYYNIG